MLVKPIAEAREIIKSWKPWPIHFAHIVRKSNSWLDFLANYDFLCQGAVQLQESVATTLLTERALLAIKATALGNCVQTLCGMVWDVSWRC